MDLKIPDGKKTYVVGIAMICYALGGLVAGLLELDSAIQTILIALGIMGIRHGIPIKEKSVYSPTPGQTPQ